jgi:hypothetical protein
VDRRRKGHDRQDESDAEARDEGVHASERGRRCAGCLSLVVEEVIPGHANQPHTRTGFPSYRATVSLGLNYTDESYTALQASRQASPGVQFNDPTRDWTTDGRDGPSLLSPCQRADNKADDTTR